MFPRFGNSGTNVQLVLMGSSPRFEDSELNGKMFVERRQVKIMEWWMSLEEFLRNSRLFALQVLCFEARDILL